ncbi:MAG: response regulator transcription factor [Pseudomonadota bacterium]
MTRPTIHVVDDDPAIRDSLALLLDAEGFEVACHADGERFLATDKPLPPGCVILDLRMPGLSGLEVHATMQQRGWTLPVLFLSAFGDIPTTVAAIKGGAEDFLTKPPDVAVLVKKVRAAVAASRQRQQQLQEIEQLQGRLAELTVREREILGWAVSGLSSRDIAQQLGLSQRTVENHRLRINRKLRTSNLLEFYHQAARCGIELGQGADVPTAS